MKILHLTYERALLTRHIGKVIFFLTSVSLTLISTQAVAAPGELAKTPLFLTNGVQPNIFLVVDDSGSMDWEVLQSSEATDLHGNAANKGDVDFSPGQNTDERELCAAYNVLAYDPNTTYTPWKGKDQDGNTFQVQSVTAAMVNPYTGGGSTGSCHANGDVNNTSGRVCNLISEFNSGQGVFYYLWDDADGDGRYDLGECPTDNSERVWVKDLSAAQKTNYANWFSYYRKREYVMKRAVSEIIENSSVRMGLATINRNKHLSKGSDVGSQVKDIDDISIPLDATAAANKVTLMDSLLGIDSSGSTSLRTTLDNTGKYFKGEMNSNALFAFTPSSDADSAKGHSPILKASLGGECQQNFALVLSDGFWNGNSPSVGNTDSDGAGLFDGQSYADNVSDTLADVAMKYYEGDLISTLDNKVPEVQIIAGKDTNEAQHLVTFTVAFGVRGTTRCDPTDRSTSVESQGWPEVCDDPGASSGSGWPTPSADAVETVDDMRHAAWNGRGQFFSAKDPGELITQLNDAIKDIDARSTTAAAAVAVNASSVQSGGNIYQAGFDSALWSGFLTAYDIGTGGLGAEVWKAHELLDARDLTSEPRVLMTYNGAQGIPLQFPANYQTPASDEMSITQVKDLLYNASNKSGAPWDNGSITASEISENQTFGEDLVAYFHGGRWKEGTGADDFRQRGGRLGDIVHSGPIHVGNPNPSRYPDNIETSPYHSWATGISRTPMVYVGSNDGALHGFNADTGVEVFAYYPGSVFADSASGGLHTLAQQNYVHQYYVDHTPAVAEVYVNSQWRTLLVGALRGGGKGLFALDVTDPGDWDDPATAAAKILWEYTDNNLGFTFSKPTLAKLNNDKWAAIFGNGYNTDPTGDGKAKLYIRYLDGSGTIIKDTGAGSIVNNDCEDASSDCNGLSTPAVVDINGDGTADRVYAGDLKGNLWVFDLTGSSTSQWGSEYPVGSGSLSALYVAKDSGGNPQPITTQPVVTLHLTKKHLDSEPNTLVFFGTGQFIVETDSTSTDAQTFYGIWDGNAVISGRSKLEQQDVKSGSNGSEIIDGVTYDIRVLTDNHVNYETQQGWFFDLPESGERVVANPLLFGELVIYTSITPGSTQCAGAGTSWLMVHDLFDGSEPDFVAIDINSDSLFDDKDQSQGDNVGGVRSGDLRWDPTAIHTDGLKGKLLIPKDNSNNGSTLDEIGIQGGDSRSVRASWTSFEF